MSCYVNQIHYGTHAYHCKGLCPLERCPIVQLSKCYQFHTHRCAGVRIADSEQKLTNSSAYSNADPTRIDMWDSYPEDNYPHLKNIIFFS